MPTDSRVTPAAQTRQVIAPEHRAGVRLDRHLGQFQWDHRIGGGQHALHQRQRQHARRTTAQEDRRAQVGAGQFGGETLGQGNGLQPLRGPHRSKFSTKGIDIRLHAMFHIRVGVEIAIGATAVAERNMNV